MCGQIKSPTLLCQVFQVGSAGGTEIICDEEVIAVWQQDSAKKINVFIVHVKNTSLYHV